MKANQAVPVHSFGVGRPLLQGQGFVCFSCVQDFHVAVGGQLLPCCPGDFQGQVFLEGIPVFRAQLLLIGGSWAAVTGIEDDADTGNPGFRSQFFRTQKPCLI